MKKPEKFDYIQWLQELKVGDEVKISAGSAPLAVIGIEQDTFIINSGTTIRYFSRTNGREQGSRPGQYKDCALYPYTDEDKKLAAEKELKQKQEAAKLERATNLADLILGTNSYSSNNCRIAARFSEEQIETLIDAVGFILDGRGIVVFPKEKVFTKTGRHPGELNVLIGQERDEKGRFKKK